MVGGAHGQVGQHALQHVVVVREPDDVFATTLHPQVVGVIVWVAIVNHKLATLQPVQVRQFFLYEVCKLRKFF